MQSVFSEEGREVNLGVRRRGLHCAVWEDTAATSCKVENIMALAFALMEQGVRVRE